MPELPEVEHLRRSLEPALLGARWTAVTVHRRSVVTIVGEPHAMGARATTRGRTTLADLERALLVGDRVRATHRHGKQMAIEGESGRVLVVQLGMTGSMTIEGDTPPTGMDAKHRHVIWEVEAARRPDPRAAQASVGARHRAKGSGAGANAARDSAPTPSAPPDIARVSFRDPRRFGGLTAYPTMADLQRVWSELGPDALEIESSRLHEGLRNRRRPIKSALLDQSVIAGVGNIYADESLFASFIHPLREAASLSATEVDRLAAELRRILGHAVLAGGSTLRDYRDAYGRPGDAVQTHAVYGHAGEPCPRCGIPLEGIRLQARATVFCPRCQDLSTRRTTPRDNTAARPARRRSSRP
jgi:formamidopyrimidine-DNA glycosylase